MLERMGGEQEGVSDHGGWKSTSLMIIKKKETSDDLRVWRLIYEKYEIGGGPVDQPPLDDRTRKSDFTAASTAY